MNNSQGVQSYSTDSESSENVESGILDSPTKDHLRKNRQSASFSTASKMGFLALGVVAIAGTVEGIRRARTKNKNSTEVKRRILLDLELISLEQADKLSEEEIEAKFEQICR